MNKLFGLFVLSLLLSNVFAGEFASSMLEKYIPGGQADAATISFLNTKAEKIPPSISSMARDEEKLNLIVTTIEGGQILAKAEVKKENGIPQLQSLSLGQFEKPTATVTTSEATAEKIYNSKDEKIALAEAIGNGSVTVQFHQDVVRQFFWFFAKTFSWIGNAIINRMG